MPRAVRCIFARFALCLTLAGLGDRLAAEEPARPQHQWALLIGVDDYANANKLRYCGADQLAIKASLEASGFSPEQIFLLHDGAAENRYRPSRGNIEKQLDVVLGLAGEQDLLFLAFSGHGVSIDGRSYLCPNDATLDDPSTLVSVDGIYERLRECEARFKLVLVDACRNDPRPGGQRSFVPTEATKALARSLQDTRLPDGVVLLNSCAPGEISYEEPELGHGVFMHYVLESLNGDADANKDGAVSLHELQGYAGNKTKTYVARKFNDSQRPFFRGDLSTEALEFALLPVRGGRVATSKGSTVESLRDEALEAARGIVSAERRFETLLRFAGPAPVNDPSRAEIIFAECLTAAREGSDLEKKVNWFARCAHYQAKAGDFTGAKRAVSAIIETAYTSADPEQRSDLLNRAAYWLWQIDPEVARVADRVDGKNLLTAGLVAARAIDDNADRCHNLEILAERYYYAKDQAGVRECLATALVAARADTTTVDICSVAKSYADFGDAGEARRVFELAKALRRQAPFRAGGRLCRLAAEQAEAGFEADALATYNEARRLGGIDSDDWQGYFAELAKRQAKQGKLAAAYKTARSIGNLSSDDAQEAFYEIAVAQVAKGDIKSAAATTEWLAESYKKTHALNAIVEGLVNRGDVAAALTTANKMRDPTWRAISLRTIGAAQLKQNDLAAARSTAGLIFERQQARPLLLQVATSAQERGDADADSMFDELLRSAESDADYAEVVAARATAVAKFGQLERALELARTASNQEAKALALLYVAGVVAEREKSAAEPAQVAAEPETSPAPSSQ